jgi:multiple sugar transport system ATP-binding protein
MAAITFKNIIKRYGTGKQELQVIHGVNAEIAKGEFIVIVGPSGCGKSTLLRMVAGLEEISDGQILIGERVVNNLEPAERDIAMVFQNYALYPHMTVFENMAYGLKIRKMPQEEIKARVDKAAKILELSHLLDRKPRQLSGGQRQRVAMGRAIVRQPKAFLFDEPLSNLDARLREQMRAEIKKLHQDLGATSIYVTHDQIEAMTLADRIVAMHGGIIQQVGSPLELYDNPANLFVAGFIGSPGMNFFDGRYMVSGEAGNFALTGGVVLPLGSKANLSDGSRATLGIRPEHVVLGAEGPNVLKATVDLVEPTGFGIIVHLKLGPVAFKAFTLDRRFLGMHGDVAVRLPVPNLHFFNEEGRKV